MKQNLLIPIRCYTCSRIIAINSILELIQQQIKNQGEIKSILAKYNYAYCCTIHYTTKYVNNDQ